MTVHLRCPAVAGLVLVVLAAFALPSHAVQSDGSLEQAYARECPDQKDTQACRTLREAIKASAAATASSPPTNGALSAGDPRAVAELRKTWGVLADLAGHQWQSGDMVQGFTWVEYGKTLRLDLWWKRWEVGQHAYSSTLQLYPKDLKWLVGRGESLELLPDGTLYAHSFFYTFRKRALTLDGGRLVWVRGKVENGNFVPSKKQTGGRIGYVFELMQPAEVAAFDQTIRNYAQQTNSNASSGNSGLFGALAMATGAALAGGNAEMVMGAAMQGAEMTTDNEMSRNVLAGQGDQMIADGAQRMYQENALRAAQSNGAAATATAPSASTPASTPASAAGSAPVLAPAAGAKAGPAPSKVPVYLVVGMRPTDRNTRNPMCYSTVFTIDAALDPGGWGNQGRVNEALSAYEGSFRAKCARLGQVDGMVNSAAQGVSSGFPRPTPNTEDYEVVMP